MGQMLDGMVSSQMVTILSFDKDCCWSVVFSAKS